MKHRAHFALFTLTTALVITGCRGDKRGPSNISADVPTLAGAWRSKIVFQAGPLAGMKDLEFLHSYNVGGTMTESSNYDEASNSSPPAYGIWQRVAPNQFQTKYVFYTTKESGPGVTPNRDWWPAGHGVLTETITLSADGQSYTSTIKLVTYDSADAVVPNGGGNGTGAGTRIVF
jgi:hypothetical protein